MYQFKNLIRIGIHKYYYCRWEDAWECMPQEKGPLAHELVVCYKGVSMGGWIPCQPALGKYLSQNQMFAFTKMNETLQGRVNWRETKVPFAGRTGSKKIISSHLHFDISIKTPVNSYQRHAQRLFCAAHIVSDFTCAYCVCWNPFCNHRCIWTRFFLSF